MSKALDKYALIGAKKNADPFLPNSLFSEFSWGSNWAANSSVLWADYSWMYRDGHNSENLDANAPWGHAYNILNKSWTEMGAGFVAEGYQGYDNSYTQAFIANADALLPMYFTWNHELPYFNRRGLKRATVGSAYTLRLKGINGRAPYTFSLMHRSVLGNGLSISPSGIITGTPLRSGSTVIQVQVTDKTGQVVATPFYRISVASKRGTINPGNPLGTNASSSYFASIQGLSGLSGTIDFTNDDGQIVSSSIGIHGKVLLPFNPADGTNWRATKINMNYPNLLSVQQSVQLTSVSWTDFRTTLQGSNLSITPSNAFSIQFSIPQSFLIASGGTAKDIYVVFGKNGASTSTLYSNEQDSIAIPINLKSGYSKIPIPMNISDPTSGWSFKEVVSIDRKANNLSVAAWAPPAIQANVQNHTVIVSVTPGYLP